MSEYKKSFSRRALLVYIIALVFGSCCLFQILNLSISKRPLFSGSSKYCLDKTLPDWKDNPLANDPNCRCYVTVNDISPVRGDILDDKENILASDFEVFDVVIDGRRISDSDKETVGALIPELTDQFYRYFGNKFPHNKDYYRKKLTEALIEYKNVTLLRSILISEKTWVNSDDTAFVRKLPLFQDNSKSKCISFPVHFKRIYPYGELAKRVIGTVPPGAQSGLELTYHGWLSGLYGAQKMLYIDGIRVPSKKFSNPQDGANIHTTLNIRMQNIVYEALMDKMQELNAQWGCAVVMEVETGNIKAMANLKKHTNEKGVTGYFEIFNHAFRQECEPGSTFKLASLLTYLEKNPNDTAKSYMLCGCDIAKHFTKDNKKFVTKCATKHKLGSPIDIFQLSLNEGVGTMIFNTYNNNFQSYLAALDSMGITMPLETQLGNVAAPRIIRTAKDLRTFYITTWGGFNMAPIQTLTFFNGVANNGKLVCPKIVSHITKQDKVLEIFPTIVLKEQMTRKDVIERAQKYLEAVVSGPLGTAKKFKDSIPHFAGKTGTRDILVEQENGWEYVKNRNSISFCGYFPVDKPKYSMIVYIYDVNCMSAQAAHVFYTIAKRITCEEKTTMQVVDKSGGVKNEVYKGFVK